MNLVKMFSLGVLGGAEMSRTPKQTLYLHIVWIIYLLQVSISLCVCVCVRVCVYMCMCGDFILFL